MRKTFIRHRYTLIKCPNCKYILAVKNGHNKQGKQRYMCKSCGYQYIAEHGTRVIPRFAGNAPINNKKGR